MGASTPPLEAEAPEVEPGADDSSPSTSRVPRLLGYLAALLALLGTVVALTLFTIDDSLVVGPDVFVTPSGPEGLIDANNSPMLVADPADPDRIVAVHRVDRPRFSAQLHWSDDGGATWHATALPLPSGTDRPYAPSAAFGPNGTLYVAYVNLSGRGNVPESLWLTSSADGGRTLSDPVRVAGRLALQPQVAVGSDGTIHLTYLQASEVGTLTFVGDVRIVAVRSDDGSTFSDPIVISDRGRVRVGGAAPAVTPDGDLVVVYIDFGEDVRDFGALPGPPWDEPFTLVFTRLPADADEPTGEVEVDTGIVAPRRFVPFLPPTPSLAMADDGGIYAAWSDARRGDEDVLLRRSTDGGATWSQPVVIAGVGGAEGSTQTLPTVAVAPTGRVDVAFLDSGGLPGDGWRQASLATSYDGGTSFTPVTVSDEVFDADVGPLPASVAVPELTEFFEADLGSRTGLVSRDDGAVIAWTDTRLGTADSGRQDIVSARVDLPDRGGVPSRVAWVVAALVAALAALLASRAAARSAG